MNQPGRRSLWVVPLAGLLACGPGLPDTWQPLVIPLASGDTLALGAQAPEGAAAHSVALRRYEPAATSGFRRVEAGTDSTGRVVLLRTTLVNASAVARRLRARYGRPREEWRWDELEHAWAPNATTMIWATYPDTGGAEVFALEPGNKGPRMVVSRVLTHPPWMWRRSVAEQVCLQGYPELCPR